MVFDNIYKEIEQMQHRPISEREYNIINSWEKYPSNYLEAALEYARDYYPRVVNATLLIDKILNAHWEFFKVYEKHTEQNVATDVPEIKPIEEDKKNEEVFWRGFVE